MNDSTCEKIKYLPSGFSNFLAKGTKSFNNCITNFNFDDINFDLHLISGKSNDILSLFVDNFVYTSKIVFFSSAPSLRSI